MAVDVDEMVKKLSSLVQLDVDAVHAYDEAIQQIDTVAVRERLKHFRNDHDRHIRELSEKIRELGKTPPEPTPDLKGIRIKGFTALRGITGTEGALKAMQTNETLTNSRYEEAADSDFRNDIKAIVEKNYKDEQRHLRYIEEALSTRAWEK
jgi:rubrerythrin